MKKIIFVCTGNTCRSPMAELILKQKLQMLNIDSKTVCVSSAGIMVNNGDTINPFSVEALKQLNIKANKNKSAKQLNKKMVTKNSVLITMTNEQYDWIKNIGNTHCISEFDGGIEIPDPYGQPLEAYIHTAKVLNFILEELAEKIKNNQI